MELRTGESLQTLESGNSYYNVLENIYNICIYFTIFACYFYFGTHIFHAYYYQVTALNAGGESVGSSEISVPVINLSGTTWTIYETVLTNSCGTSIAPMTNTANVTQAVGTNTYSGTLSGGGSFTGTISGQTITCQGSEPYSASGYNGTLNFHVTSGTWANTASAITWSGNATWSFVYGGSTYCSGTMTLAGSLDQ